MMIRDKCDVCGKGFNDMCPFKDNKNIHTGEKPYKCKFCSACFASAGNHAAHIRSHLGTNRRDGSKKLVVTQWNTFWYLGWKNMFGMISDIVL